MPPVYSLFTLRQFGWQTQKDKGNIFIIQVSFLFFWIQSFKELLKMHSYLYEEITSNMWCTINNSGSTLSQSEDVLNPKLNLFQKVTNCHHYCTTIYRYFGIGQSQFLSDYLTNYDMRCLMYNNCFSLRYSGFFLFFYDNWCIGLKLSQLSYCYSFHKQGTLICW